MMGLEEYLMNNDTHYDRLKIKTITLDVVHSYSKSIVAPCTIPWTLYRYNILIYTNIILSNTLGSYILITYI